MILDAITPPDHTPVSNGSGVTGSISGIITVLETKISAGNNTDTKLINTILIENKKTIHGIRVEYNFLSVFSVLFSFANRIVFDFTCLKYEWIIIHLEKKPKVQSKTGKNYFGNFTNLYPRKPSVQDLKKIKFFLRCI